MELSTDVLCYALIPEVYTNTPSQISSLLQVCKTAQKTKEARQWKEFLRTPVRLRHEWAAKKGHLALFRLCRDLGYKYTHKTVTIVSSLGNITILKEMKFDKYICYKAAAQHGQVEVLEWLGVDWLRGKGRKCQEESRKKLLELAIQGKHLSVIEWYWRNNLPFPGSTACLAVQSGSLEILVWCYENIREKLDWKKDLLMMAIKANNLSVIEWLVVTLSLQVEEKHYINATEVGCFEIIKLCYKPYFSTNTDLITLAITQKNVDMFFWATETDCKITSSHFSLTVKNGLLPIVQYLKSHYPVYCSWNIECLPANDLEFLEWCIEHGYPYDKFLIANAVTFKNCLSVLEYLHSLDPPCPWTAETAENAIKSHNYEALKWCVERGCPVSSLCLELVAKSGELELLRYLVSRAAALTEKVINAAVAHLEIVKYLRSFKYIPCPWSIQTVVRAIKEGNTEVVEWLVENGCPVDYQVLFAAFENKNWSLVSWFEQNVEIEKTVLLFDKCVSLKNVKVLQWCIDHDYHCSPNTLYRVLNNKNRCSDVYIYCLELSKKINVSCEIKDDCFVYTSEECSWEATEYTSDDNERIIYSIEETIHSCSSTEDSY